MEFCRGLGCHADGQRVEVGLIGCVAVKARVGPAAIVEVKIPADGSTSFADAVVGAQIHLLVFDAAPEPLDKHVVAPSAFTVHADGYAIAGERAGEGLASELRALVGVEYLRLAVARQGVLQRLDAERASIVIDSRHARTRRLNQSSATAR